MNKWIKPSELPEGFWSECFVAIHHEGEFLIETNMVKNDGCWSYYFSESEHEWFPFNSDESDIRVMVIEYPKISEEDFK